MMLEDSMVAGTGLAARGEQSQLGREAPELAPEAFGAPDRSNWLASLPLNAEWRVNGSDRLQWRLETALSTGGWKAKKYHVERDWLLVSIRQLCGPVDPDALRAIEGWPAIYPSRREMVAQNQADDYKPCAGFGSRTTSNAMNIWKRRSASV